MKRYGSSNNLADDFTYNYYSGTNKLQSVFGSKAQYTYDANGNMTKDEVNKNYNILYDHRNLMTDIRTIRQEIGIGGPEDKTYWTIYKYDEAGNRIRKITYKYNGSEPDPEFDENGDNPSWELVTNEFYIRDVSGKEIAIYNGSSLTQWNIWGLDNVGKINSDTTRNYYLKDHLGSIRVVLNSTNSVISAQDYDAWGYPLENRTYNAAAMKYDFTGKERDNETNYDYFGARYYDSRIANWTSIDPLLEKHYSYSPYNYVLRSPLVLVDPDGLQVSLHTYQLSDENISESSNYSAIGETESNAQNRDWSKRWRNPQPGLLQSELIDPVDLVTGFALAKLSFSLVGKIITKQASNVVIKNTAEFTLKESVEYALPKYAVQLDKQLLEHGSSKIFKSLKSFEKRLAEHLEVVGSYSRKSAVEREIRTFKKSIETIKQFIKEKGLKE